MAHPDLSDRIRDFWDRDADLYDRSPSHGLGDPIEAAAWRAVLADHLPGPPARVLDAGAGTGAIALLCAELGHRVTALDFSPAMLAVLDRKVRDRGLDVEIVLGPVEDPPDGPFDAVVERHVLWTALDPVRTLQAWRRVVAPGGRVVLLEALPSAVSFWGLREQVAGVARRALRVQPDHHGEYDPEVVAALFLRGARTLEPHLAALEAAGWRRCRTHRLRDVEDARRAAAPAPLGWLESIPHFAIVADA
jgi:ubiquinone/menaquinone biosynthesis C-methylase UbiE